MSHRLVDSTQCPCCPSDDTLVLAAIKPGSALCWLKFGMMGEQGAESIHAGFNTTYATIHNNVKKIGVYHEGTLSKHCSNAPSLNL